MTKMKTFKLLDFFSQLLLIVLTALSLFLHYTEKLNPIRFIIAFAIVQIISIIVHLAAGPQPWKKKGMRKTHLVGTVLVLIAIGIAFVLGSSRNTGHEDNMAGLGILLYVTIPAILLAFFYTVISGIEWMKIKKTN